MGESPDRAERNGEAGEGRAAQPESWFARPSTTGTPAPRANASAADPGSPATSRSAAGPSAAARPGPDRAPGPTPSTAPNRAQDPTPDSARGTGPDRPPSPAAGSGSDPASAAGSGSGSDSTPGTGTGSAGSAARPGGGPDPTSGAGQPARGAVDPRRPAATGLATDDPSETPDSAPSTPTPSRNTSNTDAEAESPSTAAPTPARAAAPTPLPTDTAAPERSARSTDSSPSPAAAPASVPGTGTAPAAEPAAESASAPAPATSPADAPSSSETLRRGRLDDPTTALRISKDDATRMLRQLPAPAPQASAGPAAPPASPSAPPSPERPEEHPDSDRGYGAPSPQPWTQPAPTPDAERTRPIAAWSASQPPAPSPGPAAGEFPETTSEAMEVLATLNRRPASPLRNALKRISLWGGLLCVVLAILAVIQVLRPLPTPGLKLTADSSFAFSGSAPTLAWPPTGQGTAEVAGLGSLGHTGSDNPVPIASVTKVMTAHLILKDHPLRTGEQGPLITVDKQAALEYQNSPTSGESSAKVTTGEQISEYQALQMLLIPSANNIARLLGRWDAGSDAAFVTKMKAEAGALGMGKTTYTDPSGLDSGSMSTANDQLKLAETVMLDPVFREIVGTALFVPPGDTATKNNNDLLNQYGVIGIKTGSSTAALGCLMWAAEQKIGGTTQTILGVVLSQPAVNGVGYLPMVLANSKKVIISAEAALQSHTIAKKGDVVGYVDDGLGGKVPVVASQDVTVVGWGGLSVDMSLVAPAGGVPHTAKAGTTVGALQVGSGPTAQQIPVTLQRDLVEPSYQAKLTRLG